MDKDLYQNDFASSDLPSCYYDEYVELRGYGDDHAKVYSIIREEITMNALASDMCIP